MCDEDALFRQTLDTLFVRKRSNAPGEVVHVVLQELPGLTEVLRHVELLVYLAGLFPHIIAVSPGGC